MVSSEELKGIREKVKMDRLIQRVSQLVALESENPPGNEAGVARLAAGWLQDLGFEVRLEEGAPGRPSVIASLGASKGDAGRMGRTLVWLGHLDVVPVPDPESWSYPPYEGKVSGGRLYGRGAADMKGAIGSVLEAVHALKEAGLAWEGRLVVCLVPDEETLGTHGAAYLAREGMIGGNAGIVGEPTGLKLGLAERGAFWYRLVVRGKAAHASTPHLGESAVLRAARLTIALLEQDFRGMEHPLLGRPTVNVGTIKGGTKINVVPDRCELEVDRRLLPGEGLDAVRKEVQAVLGYLREEDKGFRVEVEEIGYAEPMEVDREEEIVRVASAVVEAVTGRPAEVYGMPAITDARFLTNDCATPTVIFGPGTINQAHTRDEYVDTEQLVAAAEVYAGLILSYLDRCR